MVKILPPPDRRLLPREEEATPKFISREDGQAGAEGLT
jgi:hypothetical protein